MQMEAGSRFLTLSDARLRPPGRHRPSHGVRKVVGRGALRGHGQVSWTKPRRDVTVSVGQTGVWLVELRGFEPRTFSLRRRSRPHRSPVYALHKLHADRHGAPVPSAGGTGGARRLMQSSRPCPATAPAVAPGCGLRGDLQAHWRASLVTEGIRTPNPCAPFEARISPEPSRTGTSMT